MATYGTWVQSQDSAEEWLDDLAIDRAASGGIRIRAFYAARKRRWTLRHLMTSAEVTALASFYDSYRLVQNTFTWQRDKTAYNVYFEGAPKITSVGAGYCNVEVRFAQV